MTGSNNEDLEQEVYIRTWQNINKYKENGKFKSWISTITANLCRDYLKSSYIKNSKNNIFNDDELFEIKDDKENIENELIKKQRQAQIIKAVKSLKPKLREVIEMYEMLDMSYEEIAQKLNCPAGTVRSRLFSARKELAAMLQDLL